MRNLFWLWFPREGGGEGGRGKEKEDEEEEEAAMAAAALPSLLMPSVLPAIHTHVEEMQGREDG